MNLFELQQRANKLVQKVNEYEASLTGTEIDETDTLNQHTYADLYCLRPVMKLLFGATVDEKLNRTLDNDLPLRVFASSAPAWNSTFNLLSYNPGTQIYEFTMNYNDYGYINNWTNYRVTDGKACKNYGMREGIWVFTTSDDVITEQVLFNLTDSQLLKIQNSKVFANDGLSDIYMFDVEPNTTYKYHHEKRYISTLEFDYTKLGETKIEKSINISGSYDSGYRYVLGAQQNLQRPFLGTFDLTQTYFNTYLPINQALNSVNYYSALLEIQTNNVLAIREGDNTVFYRRCNDNTPSLFETSMDFSFNSNSTGAIDTGERFNLRVSFTQSTSVSNPSYIEIVRITDILNNRQFGALTTEYNSTNKTLQIKCPGPTSFNTATLTSVETNDIITVDLAGYTESDGRFRFYCHNIYKNYVLIPDTSCIGDYVNYNNAKLNFKIGNYYSTRQAGLCGIYLNDLKLTGNRAAIDVGYQSNQHEFMNNIDVYNNYNMCQLDVTQNSVTNKDTRIPLGINYSYSANIADALVTECQVANIFNWNTTTSTQIANNTISVNRQVPGIVCYYLGNNYNSTFTATIPYSPRLDNINSINYGTPPYYGAFYRNGNDIGTSQVGLQMGAEACRIFMPGLNYTRGKLESPQQIWQPEKLVGDNNIDKGFNWQGRAIYHELVFKNRRAGSSDAGVDFKPTLDNVADNDPQGLATRFALAQQKPFYNNRPWFTELDELYGVDPTKLVNYINNNSIIVPKDEEVYQLETFCNLVGSPDYNELTGRLTNCSSSNYCEVTSPIKLDIQNADSLEPKTCKLTMDLYFTPGNYSSTVDLLKFAAQYNNNNAIQYNPSSGHWSFYGAVNSNSFTGLMNPGQTYLINVAMYRLNSSNYRVICGLNELNEDLSYKSGIGSMISEYPLPLSAEASFTNKFFLNNSDTEYLLDKSRLLYRYNTTTDTILNFTKSVIKDNAVFDKSLFTLTGAVNLSDDGILSPITPTTGATIINENSKLDISTNKSFEVYSPRIYTSSNNGTPFKLEANNNGYIEAKVTFEADKVAASVSCQLLNFLVFDLSVYITQANINWVQFKFVNDVTSRTFKAYAMSDKSVDNWQLINEGTITTDENPAIYIINNYKLGFMDSDTDNKKLDLTSIKLILEGETLFSSMSTPGAQPMNDTEFYNQYKLDYDTWANALNKPL